jgi:hypothetical protein
MGRWKKKLNVEPILSSEEAERTDRESVMSVMTKLADAIEPESCFEWLAGDMRYAEDVEDANDLIRQMYDIADDERIWMGP